MSNSSLVSYTCISPNKNSPRNHAIDTITPHCYVGQASVEDMAAWLCTVGAQASANYGIGSDGRIGLFVEEGDRSWCSSSPLNDNRAVTIECASETKTPYEINAIVYYKLIELMADICQRNGKNKLLWFGDMKKTLAYEPKPNEMLLTVHRWFAAKECPGDYIYNRLGQIAKAVNTRLADKNVQIEEPKWYRIRKSWADESSQIGAYEHFSNAKANCPPGYTVYDHNGDVVYAQLSTVSIITKPSGIPSSKTEFITNVGTIAKSLYKETGIIPSVVIAQCCLETGYGLGADAVELMKVNNLLGMKSELLNSTWQEYTVWQGKSISKVTPEIENGKTRYITDQFRVYSDYENCIKDYEMFLLHVRSGGQYKYRKILGMDNAQDVITAISKGGYATDPSYITKVLQIIEENNLLKYDEEVGVTNAVSLNTEKQDDEKLPEFNGYYRVQVGAYEKKANAKKRAEELQEKGFSTVIKKVDDMYKVQVGAYKLHDNAKRKLSEVQSAGFADVFITT